MMRLIFLIFFALMGCANSKQFSEEQLYNYLQDEDHGTFQTVEDGKFKISVMYRPSELVAKQQMEKKTEKEYDSLTAYFSKYLYFLMEITYNGKDLETAFATNPSTFPSNISYLSEKFGDDVRLVSKTDTLNITDFIYARSYGIGTSQFLLAFEKPREEKFQIEVNPHRIGLNTQFFSFRKNELENTPHLKFN